MKLIDLSQTMKNGMTVYQGIEKPEFNFLYNHGPNGFSGKRLNFFSHTGTHIDAPFHILKDGPTLDSFDLEQFRGKALSIDCSNQGPIIEKDILVSFQDSLSFVDFVLLYTGHDQYWETDNYFTDYPVLSLEAAYFLTNFNLKGIGVDTISVDIPTSTEFQNHKILLRKNILIIENLKRLSINLSKISDFFCFPLPIDQADGSPVRAVLNCDYNY